MADPAPASLRLEMLDKMSALMTAAFGLVAALAWNDAIKAVLALYFPPGSGTEWVPYVTYAVLITIIAVLATIYIGRAAGKARERLARRG